MLRLFSLGHQHNDFTCNQFGHLVKFSILQNLFNDEINFMIEIIDIITYIEEISPK